jgi:hypothetical protein
MNLHYDAGVVIQCQRDFTIGYRLIISLLPPRINVDVHVDRVGFESVIVDRV